MGKWQDIVMQSLRAVAAPLLGRGTFSPAVTPTQSEHARLWLTGSEGSLRGDSVEPLARPFRNSLWVYRCITELQNTAGGIPLRLMREAAGATYRRKGFGAAFDPPGLRRAAGRPLRTLRTIPGCRGVLTGRAAEGELIEAGSAYEFLQRPNTYQDWPAFFRALIGWHSVSGCAAAILTELAGAAGVPREAHAVDGRLVEPVLSRGPAGMPELIGYRYRAPGSGTPIPLSPAEVKWWHLWADDDNPMAGLSPMTPGRLAIKSDYSASLFNAAAMENGTEIGLKVEFPGELTPDQRDQFRSALAQRHCGAGKGKRPLILEKGAKAEPMQASMADLQFDQGKKTLFVEQTALFRTPPVVAGRLEAAQDSSAYATAALQQYYQQTVFPVLDAFLPAFQEIVSRFDPAAVVWFDVEDQPVVQAMRLSRLDSAKKYFDMGYPANRVNELLDLGMPEVPWGDMGYLPAGLLPAADVAAGNVFPSIPEGPQPGDEEPAEEGASACLSPQNSELTTRNSLTDAQATRLWKAWAASWASLARAAAPVIRARFLAQERRVKDALQRVYGRSADSQAVLRDDGRLGEILRAVLGDEKAFAEKFRKFLSDSQELGLRQALVEAGVKEDALKDTLRRILADPRIGQAASNKARQFTSYIDARTRRDLRKSLAEGLEAGESVNALADRVQAQFKARRGHAVGIARNAVGQVLSESRHEGQKAAGMTHKGWVVSRGPGVRRPSHIAAERRYLAQPIPMDQAFMVGGESLMYPRDSSGSWEETANCQCLQVARRVRLSPEGGKDAACHGEAQRSVETNWPSEFYTYETMLAARESEPAGQEISA